MTQRHCLACDLKDQPDLIAKYIEYHAPGNVWAEVTKSLHDAGVEDMEIFITGNRLFMIIEVDETFTFERKATMDASNPKVQEWEALMSQFQQVLPWANEEEKWLPMERIFKLDL